MVLKCAHDIAQLILESGLSGISNEDFYIDDVGAFSKDWNHDVQLWSEILCHLQENCLLLTHSNAYGPSRQLTDLDTSLNHEVLSLGRRNLMPSYILMVLAIPLNYVCSLDLLILTATCGPVMPTYSNP
ncbi:hypothetical protein ACHAW6_008363 [Cyclotella cf. meneghiniana]